jgi:hypothetical protein
LFLVLCLLTVFEVDYFCNLRVAQSRVHEWALDLTPAKIQLASRKLLRPEVRVKAFERSERNSFKVVKSVLRYYRIREGLLL